MNKVFILVVLSLSLWSCKKDRDPVFDIRPSGGSDVTLQGLAGNEPGSEAQNAVYLNLRDNKATPVLRSGWDLGFYDGSAFRVVLNNTSGAGVKVLNKHDLTQVGADDTLGLTLAFSMLDPMPSDLAFFDDYTGDLTKTAIPEISDDNSKNPVIILNRGTGGGIPPRPWIKLRILRNENGYSLQYAGITDNTYKILNIAKDENFNFQFVSFDNGIVNVEPEKKQWDLVWSYSIYDTNFGWGEIPYGFSDLIAVNFLNNVEVKEVVYPDANIAAAAYDAFNKDSITTHPVMPGRWTIGSRWRSTQPATGARQDRFYLIKDTNGNFYKFKALAMGVGNDGGTRGKPEFRYNLIDK